MPINQMPPHLRNTVDQLDLPIYIQLEEDRCVPPAKLPLGDTLMMLGILRNQGKPVRLFFDPGAARELIEGHPMVKELLPPDPEAGGMPVETLPIRRSGRNTSFVARVRHTVHLPVLPVDQVRANPILAHSLYYGLASRDDRPSIHLDPAAPCRLASLIPAKGLLCLLYPCTPGRVDHFWQDMEWWVRLARDLAKDHTLVAVGADDYGPLAEVVHALIPQSHPDSTLPGLAWLMQRADAFVGRDGGLYHLAAAVNPRTVILWDSMASYRYWAGHGGHHLLFSNPYTWRYPQTMRMGIEEMVGSLGGVSVHDAQGRITQVAITPENARQKLEELFGSPEQFRLAYITEMETDEDRKGTAWQNDHGRKQRFYDESLAFAAAAARGNVRPGQNWVAQVFP